MSASGGPWFRPRGDLAQGAWESVVETGTAPGWAHTGLRIAALGDGERIGLERRDVERIVVPLAGSFTVRHHHFPGEWETRLHGRASVFAGPTDVLYLPVGTTAQITGAGRVAVAEAPARESRPWQYLRADETPIELRGAGRSSRQVHNFGTPGALDADRLIVCEVITPAGNWSSYPPHKHDEHRPGHESRLEEIYYFESAPERGGAALAEGSDAVGTFRATSSPAGRIEVDALVRTGDIVLVPYGYHGPAGAIPGYDLYYLNVMAGPDPERHWSITDDPAHAWVRETWPDLAVDERLPYRPDEEGGR